MLQSVGIRRHHTGTGAASIASASCRGGPAIAQREERDVVGLGNRAVKDVLTISPLLRLDAPESELVGLRVSEFLSGPVWIRTTDQGIMSLEP